MFDGGAVGEGTGEVGIVFDVDIAGSWKLWWISMVMQGSGCWRGGVAADIDRDFINASKSNGCVGWMWMCHARYAHYLQESSRRRGLDQDRKEKSSTDRRKGLDLERDLSKAACYAMHILIQWS